MFGALYAEEFIAAALQALHRFQGVSVAAGEPGFCSDNLSPSGRAGDTAPCRGGKGLWGGGVRERVSSGEDREPRLAVGRQPGRKKTAMGMRVLAGVVGMTGGAPGMVAVGQAQEWGQRHGNAAMVALLSRPAGSVTVQRQPNGPAVDATEMVEHGLARDSDQGLVEMYLEMIDASATFAALDRRVPKSNEHPLLLADSSQHGIQVGPAQVGLTAFSSGSVHDIIIIPKASLSESAQRSALLFELHNAINRTNHQNTTELFGSFPAHETELLAPYIRAAKALSIEWDEWRSTAEAELLGTLIDDELAEGLGEETGYEGDMLELTYAQSFQRPGEGWFRFTNFLDRQRQDHTLYYDPDAGNVDWVGKSILHLALTNSPGSLEIGEEDRDDFLEERRTAIKDVGENPFKNKGIVRSAAGSNELHWRQILS